MKIGAVPLFPAGKTVIVAVGVSIINHVEADGYVSGRRDLTEIINFSL